MRYILKRRVQAFKGVSYILFIKIDKEPYIQFGFAKDLGYYSKLSSDQIIANLEWEFLPESYGITPFCDMSKLTIKADKSLSLGEISLEEHEIILKQIIDLFHSL